MTPPIYTSIDKTPDKALFKNQRIRKSKEKPKKEDHRGSNRPQRERGSNR